MDIIEAGRRWPVAESTLELHETEEEDGDEDDTLSLSALLPVIPEKDKEEETCRGAHMDDQIQEDFDFCSLSRQSEMCPADEIFFQGHILPLRHSVSSDKEWLWQQRCPTRSISRSESLDRLYYGLISSRSSSIGSHQSSSSSGFSAGPKLRPHPNQFHTHPSPSPRKQFPSKRRTSAAGTRNSSAKRWPAWSIFRIGILAPRPEIAFHDLKPRASCRNFGSRNSTESSGSSSGTRNSSSRFMKNLSFLGGCKCSADAVDTVRDGALIIKKSASASGANVLGREKFGPVKAAKNRPAKTRLSHHRTSEWLKQLSLEEAGDDEA